MPRRVKRNCCTLDRKLLLAAVARVSKVVVSRHPKAILTCLRLRAAHGQLQLAGTDLDTAIVTTVNCEGSLPVCVVRCDELARRLKVAKSAECTLRLDGEGAGQRLVVNGGAVEHALPTFDPKEYPPVRAIPKGDYVLCSPEELKTGLGTALLATAREPSRYAIDGILFECDEAGARLVATDGRRLVTRELPEIEGPFRGSAILPRRLATVAQKLIEPKLDANIVVHIKPNPPTKDSNGQEQREPADLFVGGPRWMLWSCEPEGRFPRYRDVVPVSKSKFAIDRARLIELINEVSLATDDCHRGVTLDLSSDRVEVSAGSGEIGKARGSIPVEFLGGGDDHIVTAVHPAFLADALRSIDDEQIVLNVGQNKLDVTCNTVRGCPALIYGAGTKHTCWTVMPIHTALPPGRRTLGTNFQPGEGDEAPERAVAAA